MWGQALAAFVVLLCLKDGAADGKDGQCTQLCDGATSQRDAMMYCNQRRHHPPCYNYGQRSRFVVPAGTSHYLSTSNEAFRFSSVEIEAGAVLGATGNHPLIIYSTGAVIIAGLLNISGDAGGNSAGSHLAAGGGGGVVGDMVGEGGGENLIGARGECEVPTRPRGKGEDITRPCGNG